VVTAVGVVVGGVVIGQERNERIAALSRMSSESARANEIGAYLGEILNAADPHSANDANYTVRQLLDKSASSLKNRFGNQPVVEAEIRMMIGAAYRNLDLFNDADLHLRRAVDLRRQTVGPEHPLYAEAELALAWSRAVQGHSDEANQLVEEALRIYKASKVGPERKLSALRLYQWIGIARSDEIVERAEELLREIPSRENPDMASILHCHAEILAREKNYQEAERLARRALEMHRRTRPPGHAEIAWALWTLGLAIEGQGHYEEAESQYRKALEMSLRLFGSRPEIISQERFTRALIRTLNAQGREAEANQIAAEYRRPPQEKD
jgi:tetratricopeptide (TPR) repeat protein